jgi:hypothetical protein
MMDNLIAKNWERLSNFHYILKSKNQTGKEKFWVHCRKKPLERYHAKYGDDFNLIIYGKYDDPYDFISIPYSKLREKLKPMFLNKNRNGWDLSVYNGKLKMRPDRGVDRLDVTQYIGNTQYIPQLLGEIQNLLNSQDFDGTDEDREVIEEIKRDTNITDTDKFQLLKARHGQGKFKLELEKIERNCRITSCDIPEFLTACHLKPWSQSSHQERLDGNNGLLLSPHIHQLFDRGFLSIDQEGNLLISPKLPKKIREYWHIAEKQNLGNFRPKQLRYLKYHEDHIFLKL